MTEGFPPEKSPEEKLSDFWAEIAAYRQKELDKELKTSHLVDSDFDSKQLTGADMMMWERIKSKLVTLDEMRIFEACVAEIPNLQKSRSIFLGFLNNKTGVALAEKQLAEYRANKNKPV